MGRETTLGEIGIGNPIHGGERGPEAQPEAGREREKG